MPRQIVAKLLARLSLVTTFIDRKPHTVVRITGLGREAFGEYRHRMNSLLAAK